MSGLYGNRREGILAGIYRGTVCDIYDCCINKKKYAHCGQCEALPCSYYDQDDPTKSEEENARDYRNQLKMLREQAAMDTKICDIQNIPGLGKNIEHEKHEPEKLKWWYWKNKEYLEKEQK